MASFPAEYTCQSGSHERETYWNRAKNLRIVCTCTELWMQIIKNKTFRQTMSIRPVKNWVIGCWLSARGKVQICIWPSWCHCHSPSLAPVNPDWFYFSGTSSPGCPGQRAVKPVYVCWSLFWDFLDTLNAIAMAIRLLLYQVRVEPFLVFLS